MSTVEYACKSPGRVRGRWMSWALPVLLIMLVAGLVVVVAMMPDQVDEVPPHVALPVDVVVWPIPACAELADSFNLTAVVEPEAVVRVAAEVSGRIEGLGLHKAERTWRGRIIRAGRPLEEGDPICEGEPIVRLNAELLQSRYDSMSAQFEYDQREYARLISLFEGGSTSKTELDDARTRQAVSKAALDEAARQLERTTIQAPISGILNRLPMEVGEYASPGDVVAELVATERVKVVVDVPERDVQYLHVGQVGVVFGFSADEREIEGPITYISELAHAGARTTRLEITINNADRALRSGQIVRVRLTRRVLHDVIMIPLDSVIPLEKGRVVYIVNEQNQAERRLVELGFLRGRQVRVLSGVEAGDRLIVVGHRYVGPGQPVTVVEEGLAASQ